MTSLKTLRRIAKEHHIYIDVGDHMTSVFTIRVISHLSSFNVMSWNMYHNPINVVECLERNHKMYDAVVKEMDGYN